MAQRQAPAGYSLFDEVPTLSPAKPVVYGDDDEVKDVPNVVKLQTGAPGHAQLRKVAAIAHKSTEHLIMVSVKGLL